MVVQEEKKSVSTQKWKTMLKIEHPEKTDLVGADCVENMEYNQHEKSADVQNIFKAEFYYFNINTPTQSGTQNKHKHAKFGIFNGNNHE